MAYKYYYYVNEHKEKDGPHDLVAMMRRIRSGAVLATTLVYRGDEDPISAHVIEELSLFFNNPPDDIRNDLQEDTKVHVSIARFFANGWNFIAENQSIMVFAGFVLAFSVLCGIFVEEIIGVYAGIAAGWAVFMALQSCFFAVSLRVSRGQRVDSYFVERMLAPIAKKLLILSLIFALLVPLETTFLIIPGMLVMLVFAFASMLIFDFDYGVAEAISAARKLSARLGFNAKMKMVFLVFLYLICVVMMFPLPLMMPIFAGGLCSIYEELVNF